MTSPTPAAPAGGNGLEALVERAKAGDSAALEEIVRRVKDDVYALALKMLWHPEDAEDATQEILIRIVTHLATFRGDAAFRTWVFRVASNTLLSTRKRRMEQRTLSFEEFGEDLMRGLADRAAHESATPEGRLLEEEVKIGCTQGMLLCLDREHRIAYVLGEVFGLSGEEAAEVLAITPAAYRQRLSRARRRVRDFMQGHCGLVNPRSPCRCARRIEPAMELGRVDPERLLFAGAAVRARTELRLYEKVEEMEELHATAAVFRSHPDFAAPGAVVEAVRKVLDSGDQSLLQDR